MGTFAAAITMLFCQITFFNKFALILLMTILHATLASFIIYLVCTDCFGPSEPTKFVDGIYWSVRTLVCGSGSGGSRKRRMEGDGGEKKYNAAPDVMVNGTPTYDLGKPV